jgi:Na+/phosphate symporter
MHPSLHHVLDCAVLATSTITAILGGLVLATAPDQQAVELQLFLLPLIGSMIVSGGMVMLNPSPETRRIVIGRSIFALFIGVLMPQLVAGLHPSLANVTVKPALLVLVGGTTSGIAFVLSKPFTAELYKRSTGIAAREAERLEKKFSGDDSQPKN